MDTIKYLRVSATTDCDVKCWYCFNEGQPFNVSTLKDVDGFEWLVNQLVAEYGTEIVRFTGGEPLKSPHILDIIKAVKRTGVKKVGLTTSCQFLRDKADALLECGIDNYAVHLTQIDSKQMNYRRETDFIDWAIKKFPNVKFNIVVTTQNIENIKNIVSYALVRGADLLLLDLLQAENTDLAFEESFCSLDSIRRLLIGHGLVETIENTNSKIYSNGTSNIKLLEHYSNVTLRESYCTQALAFHPILLTPDFKFSVCTHFGKGRSISIEKAVKMRSKKHLYKLITELKSCITQCKDCSQRIILKEQSSGSDQRRTALQQ